jgi:hypothetical protein
MNDMRYKEWIQSSHSFARVEPFMIPVLQGLGRLDCQLIEQDNQYAHCSEQNLPSIQESVLLTDRFTLSYLWVLGAYEFVRTLDQRCQKDKDAFGLVLNQRIKDLKHAFERLRIPLAKMEPAKHHPNDSTIAYPAISRENGEAWQVARDVYISHRELSNALLQLTTDIQQFVSELPPNNGSI